MKLDRALQRELLERLADAYPQEVVFEVDKEGASAETVNLWYLAGHGLIEARKTDIPGVPPYISAAAITHRGLDFMADDGGLSAILNTVTVSLHADTLRALIESRVAASDLAPPEKKRFIDHLRELPAEVLRKVVEHLVDRGLDRADDAIPLLQRFLQSLGT